MSEIVPTKTEIEREKSRAFTLLELLIVILLLSLFAFLVFSSMKDSTKQIVHPGIPQIKKLFSQADYHEQELVCIQGCSKCFFLGNDRQLSQSEVRFQPIQAYIVDSSEEAKHIDFGRWKDKRVCLRIHRYSNGSFDQMILENGGVYYFIPAYFGKIEQFHSLEAAIEYWLRNRDLMKERGDYY